LRRNSPESAVADLVPIPLDLFDRLRRIGLDVDAILRRANLPRSRFSVPRPQGSTAEFFALWRAVEMESDDPGLGLRIGGEVLPDDANVVSLAAMHAPTLGEGLQKLALYKRLVCPERITIDVADGEARLRFEWLLAEDAPPAFLTDIIFAGVTNLARCGTQTELRPRRLEFMRRRSNETLLKAHFGCELSFDAPHDVLVFDESALALPMVHRNAQLLAVLLPGDRPRSTDTGRRRPRSPGKGDVWRPSGHRWNRQGSRHERANHAAPPRRIGHHVSAPTRRRSATVGTSTAGEHRPRDR
jgi:hypothetical protein